MKRARIQKLIFFLVLISPLVFVAISLIPRPIRYEIPAPSDRSEAVPYHRHPGREYIDLNGPWRFRLPGEAEWNVIAIPHTFNTLPGLEGYVGPVEYEKDIEIDSTGGHWFLHFLEVRNKARVSVNGQPVGSHATGYTSFSFDITSYLEEGRNTIAVIADNTLDDDHPPNLIGWTNYGGITREVFIEHTVDCYLDNISLGSTLNTSENPSSADVTMRACVRGANAETVEARLFSPDGALVAEYTTGPVEKDGEFVWNLTVNDPVLWDVGAGNLYSAILSIESVKGRDEVEQSFGIRETRISGTTLLLNGKPLYLKGTSRHEDFPHTACAETVARMDEDLRLIREAGFNTLRLAHYPYHPAFIDRCDRAGILAIEELPIWNASAKVMASEAFVDNCLTMAAEMVERDRNHPSIIAWGIGNEVEAAAPEGQRFLRTLKEHIVGIDPSRPVYTTFRKRNDVAAGDISDFLAINVKLGWYHGEATHLEPLLEEWHARFPEKPIVMTEHSGGATPGFRSDTFLKWSEDYQAYLLHYYHAVLRTKPYMAGDFVWPFFDYPDPAKCLNPVPFFNVKGIMTFDRRPKISYDLMKRLNAGEEPDTDYIARYNGRHVSLLSARFFGAKMLVVAFAALAVAARILRRKSVARVLFVATLFVAEGILLREFTLDNAINPAMFEGAVTKWLSLTLRPLPCIPPTLLYAVLIPFSGSLLMLAWRNEKSPLELLAGAADALWPAAALPVAFFWSSFNWIALAACAVSVVHGLRGSSNRSYMFVVLSIILPAAILGAVFLALLQWRYEFITFLIGYLFHGM